VWKETRDRKHETLYEYVVERADRETLDPYILILKLAGTRLSVQSRVKHSRAKNNQEVGSCADSPLGESWAMDEIDHQAGLLHDSLSCALKMNRYVGSVSIVHKPIP
jgi:hypothetical protein